MRKPSVVSDMVTFSEDIEFSSKAVPLFANGAVQEAPEGLVAKEILRTGEWPVIPTKGGLVKRPLKIVRTGKSDRNAGIISLEEVMENFSKAGINVQIPLSDDSDDHKNITRLNTGFVRKLTVEDREDGTSVLKAMMDFTDEEVKRKVLDGTYADVSCGIPWDVSSRGQKYGSLLEHVCITNRPFIDGLGPFLALSDAGEDGDDIDYFSGPGVTPPPIIREVIIDPLGGLSLREVERQAKAALIEHRGLAEDEVEVVDIDAKGLVAKIGTMTFKVPFTVSDGKVVPSENWVHEKTEREPAPTLDPDDPPAAGVVPPQVENQTVLVAAGDSDLEAAQKVRQIRLSGNHTIKEAHMPLTREELEGLSLSDEQRAAFQKILDENADNARKARESDVEKRIAELSDLGLKERPGFLKLYREVMLSDDGGPAVILLSDDGKQKETVTAKAILDRAIDALTVEGKLLFSDQHLVSGHDDKPPADNDDEPLDKRLADARLALGKN